MDYLHWGLSPSPGRGGRGEPQSRRRGGRGEPQSRRGLWAGVSPNSPSMKCVRLLDRKERERMGTGSGRGGGWGGGGHESVAKWSVRVLASALKSLPIDPAAFFDRPTTYVPASPHPRVRLANPKAEPVSMLTAAPIPHSAIRPARSAWLGSAVWR
jgi:hypothetical protein